MGTHSVLPVLQFNATLKPTKIGSIMLRCNTCGAPAFADGDTKTRDCETS
jgi:hypothetical protein